MRLQTNKAKSIDCLRTVEILAQAAECQASKNDFSGAVGIIQQAMNKLHHARRFCRMEMTPGGDGDE